MYHGDPAHTGVAKWSRIAAATVKELQRLDVPVAGPIISVPAIVDGEVYVGLANNRNAPGANGGQLLKIDARSGQITAEFPWSTDPGEGDSHGFMGMGSTPAVTDRFVYFGALNGKMYSLHREDLSLAWTTDLRHADPAQNQPVTNVSSMPYPNPPASIWSSPLVADGSIYVGTGEGENPDLFGFVFCLDAGTGKVNWIYCTCQFVLNVSNDPNVLPPSVLKGDVPEGFKKGPHDPPVRGCSVWSSIAYDDNLDRIFVATGNPSPDQPLPTPGFSNSVLALDAQTGQCRGHFQPKRDTSYRPTDADVDFGGSPMLFTAGGRRLVAVGCKNGGFFLLNAPTMELFNWRQLLPTYNDGRLIPTVDPHIEPDQQHLDPFAPHGAQPATDQENYSGTYSTPALDDGLGYVFTGVGGNNYHDVQAGIDYTTTPFLRAMDWLTLKDAWPMDESDPPRYIYPEPPMYQTPGEAGLSSPAVVNDLVFVSTTKVAIYAFETRTGKLVWQDQMGEQTGGYQGGYGYCLGPAISGDFVVAGGLVFGSGGVLRIYSLPPVPAQAPPPPEPNPSFEKDILPIFRQFRGSMMWRFDLTNYEHVKANADLIYGQISSQIMPPSPFPALTADQIATFKRWMAKREP